MNSGDLLAMVNQGIWEKQKSHKSYEDYYANMNNPTLKKIVEGVLQRDSQHLEILNSLKGSIDNNGNVDQVAVLAAERLINNSAGNSEQIEMMKILRQELGEIMPGKDEPQVVVFDDEVTEMSDSDPIPNVASHKTRPRRAGKHSNNGYINRSVVSCSLNYAKSINKMR